MAQRTPALEPEHSHFIRTQLGQCMLLTCLLFCGLLLSSTAQTREYHYADAHLHYVDFFQEGQGMTALVRALRHANVEHAMVSGMPLTKQWQEDEPRRPRYYAGDAGRMYWYSATDYILQDALLALPARDRKHLHPFISGFNPTDKNATMHIERLLESHPGLWKGIGEIFTRHDDLSALTVGEAPRANNEAMHRIYRLAGRHKLPVLLHSNITSQRERDPIYIEELEDALQTHRNVKFLWAHAGTSKELHRHQEQIKDLDQLLRTLLTRHANLHIDLSWSVLDPYILESGGSVRPNWVKLIEDFPDRFTLGSDVIGKFDGIREILNSFDVLLDALQPATARKLARANFLALLPPEIHAE